MPAIRHAKPRAIFTDAEWRSLRAVSSWRGLALVGHAWGVAALALWAGLAIGHPLAWAILIPLIGARQLGMAILMHEAAHGLLHPNQRINDAVGRWLCGAPVGVDLRSYRDEHLRHHKFTQQPEDPDLPLSAPFPIRRVSLWRKIARDLSGWTFVRLRFAQARMAFGDDARVSADARAAARRALAGFAIINGGLTVGLLVLGAGGAALAWWLALATWFQLAFRIRNIAEHACTTTGADPFTHARTTLANPLERWFLAPYWVHYHTEHHLFMYLPCYRLEQTHALLRAKGLTQRMTIAPGYLSVLRRVVTA